MQKETNPQSNNQEEIKKNEKGGKHPLDDVGRIGEIVRFIADSSHEGRYTLERHKKSLYRFGFGISKSGDAPSMFVGKTANEAMYRAIDFELASEIKLASRDELTKLAEDRLATIQDGQQKHKGLEEKLATKNTEYKELMKGRDELKQEMESISNIIGRVADQWKDDAVMRSFEKNLASWKKASSVLRLKTLSKVIAFILENTEKLMQLEERPLREKILATVKKDRILESLWNDLRDLVMDGEWHAFSEADEIIMRHGYRQLTIGRIWRIRQKYFQFAKDEDYHIARGGKDYLFELKKTGGVNKFRFTLVVREEEVRPEKKVEKGLELGRTVDRISAYSIYENPRDEFIGLFCDGRWHAFSEPVEMLKKYDIYSKYKQLSFPPLKSAYMVHVQKFYRKIKKREGVTLKFKFEKKRAEAEAIKLQNAVKCARCGQAIRHGKKSYRIDNLFYHPDCYEAMT